MSEPVHRRRRHHIRKGSEPAPADFTRVVLRRRRCESEPTPTRFRRGSHWRQGALVVLTLLAAGPVWALGEAIAERYHEEFAAFVQQTRQHLDWTGVNHPEAALSGPFVPSAPAPGHGATGTFASAFASAWERRSASSTNAMTPAHATPANLPPRGGAWTAVAPSFTRAAGAGFPALAGHLANRYALTAAHTQVPAAAGAGGRLIPPGVYTWTGGGAPSSTTPSNQTYWTNGANWNGSVAPGPNVNAVVDFQAAGNGLSTSTVDTNYAINNLGFDNGAPAFTIGGANNATLTINNAGVFDASTNPQTISLPVVSGGGQSWNVFAAAGSLTVNAALTGTGGLLKTGPGTLTFSGTTANSFGSMTVTGGTLVLNKSANVAALGGDLSIGNATNPGAPGNAVVQLRNDGQTAATTNVTIYSDGLFDVANGSGSGQANNEAQIKNLTMTGGEVRLGAGDIFLSTITTNASATSALISSTDSYDNLQLEAGVTANVARGTATYDLDVQAGMANGTLIKTGAGIMRLAGNTNGGHEGSSITLEAGTIALANNNALGEKPDVTGPSTFTFAGGTLTADGGDRTIANPVALTGSATVGDSLDGTPRAITFTGGVTLTGSQTLTVNNTAATTFSGPVNLGNANTLTVDGTGNTLVSGVVSDTTNSGGGLTKQGNGTLTLTANNTYSGNTVVSAGKLFVNNVPAKAGDSGTGTGTVYVGQGTWLGGTGVIGGNVAVGVLPTFNPAALAGPRLTVASGTLTPGVNGPGVLTVNGSVDFASSGTLEADLAGPNPGTGYDQVKVGGSLTLSGTLTLTTSAGANLFVGEKFYLFDLTSTTGTVSQTFENALAGGVFTDNAGDTFQIKYNDTDPADGNSATNDVSLTVLSVPEPGTWAMLGLGAAMAVGMTRRRVAAS